MYEMRFRTRSIPFWFASLLVTALSILSLASEGAEQSTVAPFAIKGFKSYPVQILTQAGDKADRLSREQIGDDISVLGFQARSRLILIRIQGPLGRPSYVFVRASDVIPSDEAAFRKYTSRKGRGLICDPRQIAMPQRPNDTSGGGPYAASENPCGP